MLSHRRHVGDVYRRCVGVEFENGVLLWSRAAWNHGCVLFARFIRVDDLFVWLWGSMEGGSGLYVESISFLNDVFRLWSRCVWLKWFFFGGEWFGCVVIFYCTEVSWLTWAFLYENQYVECVWMVLLMTVIVGFCIARQQINIYFFYNLILLSTQYN